MNAFNPAPTSGAGRDCWLPALQLSAQEVFGLMLGCALAVPQQPPLEHGLDVTAVVGLAGPVRGIVTARCSRRAAAHMASRMLGIAPEQAGSHLQDALGELCNMIAGNFKNKICALGDCMLSVPTVVTGADYRLHLRAREAFHTVLLFEGQPLVLDFEVHDQSLSYLITGTEPEE